MEFNSLTDYMSLFILQFIPNGFIYILAGYVFAQKPVVRGDYIRSSLLLAVSGLIFRAFSWIIFSDGSSTLSQTLTLLLCVFLLVYINKIPAMHAIISTLFTMLLQLVFEVFYMVIILEGIFKMDMDLAFEQSNFTFSLIGLPNMLALGLFMVVVYKVRMKRRDKS